MDEFAESVGIAPAGFRLLVGVLLGYPISIGYRIFQDSMNVPLRVYIYYFFSIILFKKKKKTKLKTLNFEKK